MVDHLAGLKEMLARWKGEAEQSIVVIEREGEDITKECIAELEKEISDLEARFGQFGLGRIDRT